MEELKNDVGYTQAEAKARKLLDQNKTCFDGWYLLGAAQLQEGRFDQAISSFQEALKCKPNEFLYLLSFGIANINQKQYENEIENFRTVAK